MPCSARFPQPIKTTAKRFARLLKIDEPRIFGDVPAPLRDLRGPLAEVGLTYPDRAVGLAITIASAAAGPDIYVSLYDLNNSKIIDEWDYAPGPAVGPEQIIRKIVWFICLSIFNAVVEPQEP
jgi:hypothetical protein